MKQKQTKIKNLKGKKLRIVLILPDAHIHKLKWGRWLDISFREAPLTATTLAALVPPELAGQIEIVDESIGQKISFNKNYDLVGISVLTGTAPRAYQLAQQFRRRGTPVVLGGVHVTLMPEEASQYADSIVLGFAEKKWPQLLRDFSQQKLKKVYNGSDFQLNNIPSPRRDLQKKLGYMVPYTVLMTRGCRGTCDFCSVPAAKYGWSKRPIAEIITELKAIKSRRIAISDVHLTDDVEHAKELFAAMIPLKKKWGALASTRIGDDPELLDLMQKSGCSYLLIGFESVNNNSLQNINKGFNRTQEYKELVAKLHERNILVQGCFIFGFDEDTPSIFPKTVAAVNDFKIDIPRYALYTPYPKTVLFKRLKKEKRILHEQWQYYDTQHVVIVPKNMSPYQLDEGFRWTYRQTFKLSSSLNRALASRKNRLVTLAGNLAYRIYLKRLEHDSDRFPEELIRKPIKGARGDCRLS
jgi:radical SAM superfamily enzyme YgiQ (UPF0313 family)